MTAQSLFSIALAAVISLCVLSAPSSAQAHEFDPDRQVVVQVFPDHVDILILYTEAPGERSDLFTAMFGFGVSDQLGDAFEVLAQRAFLPRMLDGLEFEIEGEKPRTHEPELRFEDHDGHLMAAAFVRYDLKMLGEEERRTFVIRAQDRSLLPTTVTIYGGEGLQPIQDGPSARRAVEPKNFDLLRGQSYRTSFAHP